MDMSSYTIVERETHVNACLNVVLSEQSYMCPLCGEELSRSDARRRTVHVNRCLDRDDALENDVQGSGQDKKVVAAMHTDDKEDRVEEEAELLETQLTELTQVEAAAADLESESECSYVCKICGFDMSKIDLMRRIRHVKLCGEKFGVRPKDMAVLAQTETIAAKKEVKVPNAFDIMVQCSEKKEVKTEVAKIGTLARMWLLTLLQSDRLPQLLRLAVGADRSNVFDVLMRGSKTAAVLSARKRSIPFKFTRKAIQRRRLSYPDFKCIQGTNPPFIVDGFNYACPENSSIYFLTHFHSDHYCGITKDFNCGIIYCNIVTAKLVVQELGVQSKYVHPVGMNIPVIVADVQVTFMDANHCPGAAIILFELKDGKTYLHTGDFRFHKRMLDYYPLQPYIPTGNETIDHNGKIIGLKRLDGVYLDTTYCDPKYTFPPQQVAIDHALEQMDKHYKQKKVLFLVGSYTIGKERLFIEIARKFQKKVCVTEAKLRIIETFGWPAETMQLLTTQTAATNLHVVRMQDLQMENLTRLLAKHRLRFHRIVAFRPTGWTYNSKNPRSISTCCMNPSGKICVYGIPYSEHSSFVELSKFVQIVNPVSIIPTVNCSNKRKATNQVNTLRQVAFHNISVMLKQQGKLKKRLNGQKHEDKQHQISEEGGVTLSDSDSGDFNEYSGSIRS